ncbi:hypothetical protein [Sphingopyxis sp. L1A2A]|uniref:hypothetical protein n=1 Tax=Sphingopyxis sp. L1A2A TaxID=2502247 RepID=UPI0014853F18|nr:hypothetical protein [Sphingopyxis sp. L1A2A]
MAKLRRDDEMVTPDDAKPQSHCHFCISHLKNLAFFDLSLHGRAMRPVANPVAARDQ